MAGSYEHVVNPDGSYRGVDLLDHLGDADEALEDCVAMINWLTGGDKRKLYEAWLNACVHPDSRNSSWASFERFLDGD